MNRQAVALLFSSAFGILMVLTAVRPSGAIGLVALALSAAGLLAGLFIRQAAVGAVLVCIVAMAVDNPDPLFAAVAGLSAAVYLVLRYSDISAAATLTLPTAVGLVGFTAAGVAATAVGVQVKWLPLAAPLIVVAILVVVALPLWADERTGVLAGGGEAAGPSPESSPES